MRASTGIIAVIAAFLLAAHPGAGRAYAPGDTVRPEDADGKSADAFFRILPVDDSVFARMKGKSYKDGCTVSRDSLRYVRVLHKDASGAVKVGEMVVAKSIADDILDIMRTLYEASYPIERMVLIDEYGADDDLSMRADNSSAFNYRKVAGTAVLSKHSLGLAVDINPLYNPYCKRAKDGRMIVSPANAAEYADRSREFPYKIEKGDLCYRLFTSRGFKWGGDWKSLKDYQHFEK
ncbi:MAG: M15 family metallopeptidase [Bacteroidales bacterium]|nr:M15 family metallopeptidase [Bacteroidales bacterium]